ncbi:hypothetical protein JRB95_001374 [Listeria monocytogenes]|nr:hypothetical protein [Listeria monocytogenes]
MKFIKITQLEGSSKWICYISVDKIIRIGGANDGALIDMQDKVFIFTEETPEQILELIEKAGEKA